MANPEILSSVKGEKPGLFYGYIIVITAFFAVMVSLSTYYMFGVFLKPVATELGWTRAITTGAHSLAYLLLGLLSMVTGGLNDRFGPRVVVTACGFSLGLGLLLMSQINAVWQLYLFYGVLVSIGMSAGIPLTSIIARWFVKRRGLMTGIVVAGVGVGVIIMPPVASQLISNYGWRTSYIIIGIIAMALIVIAAQFLKRDPSQIGQLPYGVSEVEQEGLISETKGFSLREAVRSRQFWVLGIVYFLFLFSQQTIVIHIVPHATDIGISAVSAASILSVIGGLSIIGRIGLGSAGDRIGNKPSLTISLIFLSAALFWLQLTKELWMFYLFAIAFGIGYGGLMTLQSPIVADLFSLRAHGAIFGAITFLGTIGGAIGSVIAGRIFDVTGSYYSAFWACATASIIALILTPLLTPPRKEGLEGSV